MLRTPAPLIGALGVMNSRVGNTLLHFGANESLIRAFVDSRVRFILIGGLAISWYCPERTADDMDLLVRPSTTNSNRIASALSSLKLLGFNEESFTKPNLQVPLKHLLYAELLTPRSDAPTYEEIESRAINGKLYNIPIQIASVEDLITMKRAAAMDLGADPKHNIDIGLLTRHDA